MPAVIDSDQHLYETRTTWLDHIDPDRRADALQVESDELGYPWLTWRGRRLQPVDVQYPGLTSELGARRERIRAGLAPESDYDADLPEDYWNASARADRLAAMGVDEAVVFPNFGLLWERTLDPDVGALTANMTAWNRWCGSIATDGKGRVHPVAHVTLRDKDWLFSELARLERDGVRMAMVAPATVDGRALSHPDHDTIWNEFVHRGITPTFHDVLWLPHDPEFRLWVKTLAERYGEVEAAIRGLHPYELPAIYALPVAAISAPYAEWVESASA